MKKLIEIFVVMAVLTLLAFSVCKGSTYYVDDANGNDANTGASGDPWKTLARAYTWTKTDYAIKVTDGDTVLFRNGSYGEFEEVADTYDCNYFGSRTDWVTYKADTGHTPDFNSIHVGAYQGRFDYFLDFNGIHITSPAGVGSAVMFWDVNNIRLGNCSITGQGSTYVENVSGTSIGVEITGGHNPSNILIDDCNFNGVGTGATDGFITAIKVWDGDDITISNNEIAQFSLYGIDIPSDSTSVTLTDNTFSNYGDDATEIRGETADPNVPDPCEPSAETDEITEYYVDDANGNDANTGDSTHPWKTISRAYTWRSGTGANVSEGETVYFRDGSYGTFKEIANTYDYGYFGNRSNWVTYKNAAGHTPDFNNILIGAYGSALYNYFLDFNGIRITPVVGKDNAVLFYDCNNVRFQNCTIIGQGANYVAETSGTRDGILISGNMNSSNILVDGCTLSGGVNTGRLDGFESGIRVEQGDKLTLTNNDISQFHKYGIGVPRADTSIIISNNNIHNFSAEAGIGLDITTVAAIGNILVSGNRVYDCNLYTPDVNAGEVSTATTWNAAGTVMTNVQAAWGVTPKIPWVNGLEIYVVSGTNVLEGDNDVSVSVVGATEITLNKTIGDGVGTPSNVVYYFRDSTHTDLLQCMALVGFSGQMANITIRNNWFYDSDDAFCNISPYTTAADSNWIIENNVFYKTTYTAAEPRNLWIDDINGLNFRNNIVIGGLYLGECANTKCSGNIISFLDKLNLPGTSTEDYDIINRHSALTAPASFGVHTTDLNGAWDNAAFRAIFNAYTTQDFNSAAGSIALNNGDPCNYSTTDILGLYRDASPDAGAYEKDGTAEPPAEVANHAPILDSIGAKSVNEGVLLSFRIRATDADANTITYDANALPTDATFADVNLFSWTPSYSQSGTYDVNFFATDGELTDSEKVTITVNNIAIAVSVSDSNSMDIFKEMWCW